MKFTLREEIIILTSIYCFCLFTIPIIIIDANSKKAKGSKIVPKLERNSSDIEFQRKVLSDSITILENLNNNSDEIYGFSDLLDLSEEDYALKYPNVSFPTRISRKMERKRMINVWKQFDFVNKTVLNSRSLRLPLTVDWREENVISDVKTQQSSCGSCFAVSVVETIESMVALRTGELHDLSVQQMIDCNSFDMGCEGGNPCRLLEWLYNSQVDVQSREDYPSLKDFSQKQDCVDERKLKDYTKSVKVKDYLCNDFVNREELLLLYLAYQGPLIASINGLPLEFYDDVDIVERNCDSENLNHVVQIVGYDMSGDVPFYIIKNSWGQSFGSSGYMRIAIGRNVCGVAQKISAVMVDYKVKFILKS